MTEEQICEKLQQVLKPGRYRHTLGVADTAERMATVWHVSPAQARLAGLLHDCGKEAGDALSHGPIGAGWPARIMASLMKKSCPPSPAIPPASLI